MGWKEYRIGEICEVGSSTRIYKSEYVESGIPFYRGKEIINLANNDSIDDPLYISEKRYSDLKSNRSIPKKGDILMISIGATLGVPYYVDHNKPFYFKDGNVTWFSEFSDYVDNKFLYNWLRSDYGYKVLWTTAIGSAQPALTLDSLRKIEVKLPPIETQQKISSILSAFDDLIENNSRRIAILEEMARRIYRDWFVHFKYPSHENDELVDSGTELGEIPEGWEVLKLGDVLTKLESGNRPKGGVSQYDYGMPSVGAENVLGVGKYDYSKEKYVPKEFYEEMNKGLVEDYDVLIYKDGASLGRVSIFGDGFPHSELCINSHAYLVRTDKTCSQAYLYFWMDSPLIESTIRNSNTNAAQPGINMGDVRGFQLLIPSKKVLRKFDKIGEPIVSEIFHLAKKNQRLKETRDLLLPKLISGKIDVGEMELAI